MTVVEYRTVLHLQTRGFLQARNEELFGLVVLRHLFAPRPARQAAESLAQFSKVAAILHLDAHAIEALLVLAESASTAELGWLAVCEAMNARTPPDRLTYIWQRALAEVML